MYTHQTSKLPVRVFYSRSCGHGIIQIFSRISGYLLILVMFLLLSGCKTISMEEKSILENLENRDRLISSMDSLSYINDSLWDEVVQSLATNLPADLPPDERRNMLQVKNSDLIQMFQVFDSLDTPLQQKVLDAGKVDQQIADAMRKIMVDIDQVNKNISINLGALEKKDSVRYAELKVKVKIE